MSKAEKLAAARRKLKEFQQKNKENTIDGAKSSHDKIAVQSSSSNPDQNIVNKNLIFDSGTLGSSQMIAAEISARELDTSLENQTSNSNESANNINIENIFKNVNSSNNNSELNKVDTNYDDTFSKSNIYQDDPSGNSQLPTFQLSNVTPTNYFDNISSPQQNPNITDNLPTDVFAARDFFDNVSNFTFQNSLGLSQNETNISLEAEKENHRLSTVADFFQNNVSDDIEPLVAIPDVPISQTVQEEKPSSSALSVIPPVDSVLSAKESDDSNILDTKHQSIYPESVQKPQSNKSEDAIESPTNQAEPGVTKIGRSSTESLRQLSLQINDLIDDDARDDPTSGVSELERRNQELAARLSAEQQKCEQFEQQIKAYHSRVSELQLEADRVASEVETRLARELGPLQEQLQLHVQTVGILVGEKTELQAALAKSQQTAKQKSGEVEELQGRVKAAKQLISDLEKEVSSKAESGGQVDKANRELSQELDRLRLEHRMLGKQLEETEEEASELRQKLSARTGDCAALRQDLQDKQSQLALTQLRVQQLSSADNPEVDSQLELLHQHKISLERQLTELQQTLKTVAAERDQASQQYQQYVQQLNAQVTSLATKVSSTSLTTKVDSTSLATKVGPTSLAVKVGSTSLATKVSPTSLAVKVGSTSLAVKVGSTSLTVKVGSTSLATKVSSTSLAAKVSLTSLATKVGSTSLAVKVDSTSLAVKAGSTSLAAKVGSTSLAVKVGSTSLAVKVGSTSLAVKVGPTSLAVKLEQVSAENEQLSAREQGLVRHVSDLEKQLQQHQQTPQGAQELEQSLTVLVAEKRELSGEIEAQSEEMQRLHLELEEKNQRVEELESLVERLQGDQPDQHKLLAAMESDKVAASRAVGQNQQLKKQLEELQEGFVRVSNNKLELTEKLQYEQHISKELAERLAQSGNRVE
uniref:Golgin subfamily A conserved domain-containing protein n=1 Tax=Timema douglasi TaxID=61478 RepID=A0A7R8VK84_TIMDO|nr:unnamed protein product [Timema douglasi]